MSVYRGIKKQIKQVIMILTAIKKILDNQQEKGLKKYGKTRGVAGLCIGGGEATAMALEII